MNKKLVAVVLCGGIGSRMSQLTKKKPKPLITVHGKPIIWYVVSLLLFHNIKDIIFPLGYGGNKIEKFIRKNFRNKLNNFFFLKTGEKTEIKNRIKKSIKKLKLYENFIIINADTILNLNIKNFYKFHLKKKLLITLSGVKMRSSWGSIVLKKNNYSVEKFDVESKIEKYHIEGFKNYSAFRNTGVSIINCKCLNFINKTKKKDFEISLYNKYLKKNLVGAKVFEGIWYPIETLKDLNAIKINKKLSQKIKLLKKKFNNF